MRPMSILVSHRLPWYDLGRPTFGRRCAVRLSSLCSTCVNPRAGNVVTTNPDNEPQRCGRPDCHQIDEVFIVERIIGKQTLTGGEGRKNMWLTKWFSYPAAQATWEDVEQTVTNASRFIEEFTDAAAKEGRDVDENFYGIILLQEAVDAGWRDE
ncbi:hypothetical protein ARMGADRAFT_134167 [Armillaria gallica]|uniref:Chromo domain-containing protein n=1 Tax=Armillaria gallica TaxID=47427 RepID=A0A2H3CCC5_ARMGA|nr:hypothetical protein ARMGADRAFT_134167 [Armillaria gallica]